MTNYKEMLEEAYDALQERPDIAEDMIEYRTNIINCASHILWTGDIRIAVGVLNLIYTIGHLDGEGSGPGDLDEIDLDENTWGSFEDYV